MQFFDVTIGIKIPFFRVSVTIEPGRSLLQFVTTKCLIRESHPFFNFLKSPSNETEIFKVGLLTGNIAYSAKRISP